MNAGDLVRLDVGCEWNHYGGDLGRTVPVSGRYSADQREIWDIFVSAYHAGAKSLREGATVDQVFAAWSAELIRHRESARSALAKQAVDGWSKREQVPNWQIHTMNLSIAGVQGPMRAGTTLAFEPIASIGGQGYYLEDLFLITKEGAELLTPGVPYSAEEIELRDAGPKIKRHHVTGFRSPCPLPDVHVNAHRFEASHNWTGRVVQTIRNTVTDQKWLGYSVAAPLLPPSSP
jgi:hypothetical protein